MFELLAVSFSLLSPFSLVQKFGSKIGITQSRFGLILAIFGRLIFRLLLGFINRFGWFFHGGGDHSRDFSG